MSLLMTRTRNVGCMKVSAILLIRVGSMLFTTSTMGWKPRAELCVKLAETWRAPHTLTTVNTLCRDALSTGVTPSKLRIMPE
mmetsp:Transcript_83815/g.191326  ORF Transcript_83815/g.191326 Transcript_83815/m.191326 type:complete len:82 (+) Transcript_83815:1696-1941(+)